jgi:hypothetical protein
MSLRHSRISIAIAICIAAAASALAQEGTAPMPDSAYGYAPDAYRSPMDLTMPPPDDGTNPDVVTIPIPGGGEITVDGPDAPSEQPIPVPPGAWGTQQQNPFSHGTGPIGP